MTDPETTASSPASTVLGPRAVPRDLDGSLRLEGFTLGDWRVEPRRHRIVSQGEARTLDPRLIDVLIALAARPGEVVTRDELLDSVWRDTFVSENSLSQAISRLRKALGDDSQRPRYVETISKWGYRLVATVHWQGHPGAAPPIEVLEAPERSASPSATNAEAGVEEPPATVRSWLTWATAGAVVLVAIALWSETRSTSGSSRSAPRVRSSETRCNASPRRAPNATRPSRPPETPSLSSPTAANRPSSNPAGPTEPT